jgi:hypothetical protein
MTRNTSDYKSLSVNTKSILGGYFGITSWISIGRLYIFRHWKWYNEVYYFCERLHIFRHWKWYDEVYYLCENMISYIMHTFTHFNNF